ncbi:POK9 protein, partial [Trogon melanurus]|nr:POK9 protein [Trogon melanurus]NXJ83924.1 POK9 protein [Trogon melanurus]
QGSAGLDVAMAFNTTIKDTQIHVVPSTANGLLGHGLSALLLGRSSASKQGIIIIPGVIDADYKGNIGIMVQILSPPIILIAGSRIAQLVPFKACVAPVHSTDRGEKGFGSTGMPLLAFSQTISHEKPVREVNIAGPYNIILSTKQMMIDTGSDVTIIP